MRLMRRGARLSVVQALYEMEIGGRGVARQLVGAVYEICRSRGVSSVYWHTHASNTAARLLYDKLATNTGFLVYRAKA